MKLSNPIPIIRSFDEAKAKEFYIDFLGFRVDWEHRFDENAPLYMQLLIAKRYKNSRPGINDQPWGRDMGIADPFGNRLIFTHLRHS